MWLWILCRYRVLFQERLEARYGAGGDGDDRENGRFWKRVFRGFAQASRQLSAELPGCKQSFCRRRKGEFWNLTTEKLIDYSLKKLRYRLVNVWVLILVRFDQNRDAIVAHKLHQKVRCIIVVVTVFDGCHWAPRILSFWPTFFPASVGFRKKKSRVAMGDITLNIFPINDWYPT